MKLAHAFRHGPLRTIMWQMLLVSILPLAVLAAVALSVSRGVAETRFRDEATLAATIAQHDIAQKEALAQRTAQLIASLPTTRNLVADQDMMGLMTFLIPLK